MKKSRKVYIIAVQVCIDLVQEYTFYKMTSSEATQNNNIKEIYEKQAAFLEMKRSNYKIKEARLMAIKEEKKNLVKKIEEIQQKLNPVTFLVESTQQEQIQTNIALTQRPGNDTLQLKYSSIQRDLEKYCGEEKKLEDIMQSVYDNIMSLDAKISKQYSMLFLLKDELFEEETKLLIAKRNLLAKT
ncbi:uncharacterized protein LOC130655676 [Hydractinia symbiolongicarpus]|uniref:uncharacterized protein LOC130655676 n=1 Tax=Hydractinia symbiolongicarpus TaxID=13093 RepID=UPI00254AB655|nr:uncharacterized protein LOC130655676 [Hydractinia symbiolongicarpus]